MLTFTPHYIIMDKGLLARHHQSHKRVSFWFYHVISLCSSDYKEEAVIKKLRSSGSLLTPDETVTVSFITKTSHIKKPFPVTHHKLLTADDLSSAGID